jgi:hypothetical protein
MAVAAAGVGVASAKVPPNPSANRTLGAATQQACATDPSSQRCVALALADIDAARASEGVGPASLPGDFTGLSVPEQLLVLSNLERIDRGQPAIDGLSSSLDAAAATAAADDEDPTINPSGGSGSWGEAANWEGGESSSLASDFEWMYDDGYGSGNLDCTSPSASGCWGHRDDILADLPSPLLMGAAEDPSTPEGFSMTELFFGGDGGFAADLAPTWATIAATLPIGVSATSLRPSNGSASLELWASGLTMDVRASLPPGSGWSVAPSSCDLAPGATCKLTLTATAAAITTTLTLTGPNAPQTVALEAGTQTTLTLARPRKRIGYGATAKLTGKLEDAGGPLSSQTVTLVQHAPGSDRTSAVASARTGRSGTVTFKVKPKADTDYSLAFAGADGLDGASSASQEVQVAAAVRAHLAPRRAAPGTKVAVTGTVAPAEPHAKLTLEERHGRAWRTVATARLGRKGTFQLTLHAGSPGSEHLRVTVAATSHNAAGTSPTLTLRIT